jgi:protein-disulfide isomerase
MKRRLSVLIFRRSILALVLLCLGCSAQSAAPDLSKRVERQIRAYYNVPPSVKITVGAPKGSEFNGYQTLPVTFVQGEQKQDHDFLLSKDGKTLVRFTKIDISSDPYAATMKKIDVAGRPVRGAKDAKVVIVNYDDFECPFCSRMHQTLFPGLLKEYGDRVKIIYKDYPLVEIHPWAVHAAVDANCLVAQNNDAYWDFADYVHAHQHDITGQKSSQNDQFAALDKVALTQGQTHNLDTTKLQSCLKAQDDSAVKASMKEAGDLGVSATPTLFVNGEKVDGALPAEEMRAVLDRALKEAGIQQATHPATPDTGKSATGPTGQ